MKKTRVVQESYSSTHIDAIVCDICKKEYRGEDWGAETYGVKETVVSFRDGISYPEGGSGTEYEFDVCPTCFVDVLVPTMKSLWGAVPQEREWDY